MCNRDCIIGIDTSNYKTSLALTDFKGDILFDSRKPLIVKQGERGLRQSHALFQHMDNLPVLISSLFREIRRDRIGAVAVSDRPRPVEGSYMPVFKAGINFGRVIADSLEVPFYAFSHQEGHIEAVKHHSVFSDDHELLVYHLSGGTCELLHVKDNQIEIVGGSKDISFGQVIDRVGVSLGMGFPAGEEMDRLATEIAADHQKGTLIKASRFNTEKKDILTRIPMDGLFINLSGLETQCQRGLKKGIPSEQIISELFQKISDCICQLTKKAVEETGCEKILFSGGVSGSTYLKTTISRFFSDSRIEICFGEPALSADNAVGISLLGGKKYGDKTNQGFTT